MSTLYPMSYRRNRKNEKIRDLVAQVNLSSQHLIQPYFIYQENKEPKDILSLKGQKSHTIESVKRTIELGLENGVSSVMLFVVPQEKKENNFSYDFDCQVIESIKETFNHDLNLFTDLCMCSQTHSGHCGIWDGHHVCNESSVQELTRKGLMYAQAGSDALCPSDMMDDRIISLRNALDEKKSYETLIMSYSTKFASAFYGPFRSAADCTPEKGDRKTYQIDPRNIKDALRCSVRDLQQGADILMVKPAMTYLDVIYRLKQHPETSLLPLCAYHVSGEYQSLCEMGEKGLMNFENAYYESLIAMRRAGADMIITYGANDFRKMYGN